MTIQPPPQQPLVLIADDDEDLRQMLAAVLRAAGFRTETFENGKLLQQRAMSPGEVPAAILTDIDMPRMDGLTAISEIRKLHPRLPIVVLSAIAEAPRVAPTAHACGATLVVGKPFGLVEVRRQVEKLVEQGAPAPTQDSSQHAQC